MAEVSSNKSGQKNNKRKQKKVPTEHEAVDNEEVLVEPAVAGDVVNPIELVKKKIEEAKLLKDRKKTQELREQLWALQDKAAGKTVEGAPTINPLLLQHSAKPRPKDNPPKEVATSELSNDKRLKQLRKKLDQVINLKERKAKGETLEQNQLAKMDTEQDILDEIEAIEEVCRQLTLR